MSDSITIAGFALVFTDNGKGQLELSTEVTTTDAKKLLGILGDEDWVVVNAAINAIKRVGNRVEQEIHREIEAVRSA